MTILSCAPCMASSGPNPYGQPQAPASSSNIKKYHSSGSTNNQQNNTPTSLNSSQTNKTSTTTTTKTKTTTAPIASGLQLAHMPHDGGDKPLVHSANYSSLANNYDGYIAGMSSDSELTTGGGATTRHHHHYHHRPYSSQSRVYHAHPVPKTSPASSRMSHYSDSAAVPNVQSSSVAPQTNTFEIHQQQQQISNQPTLVSMTSAINPMTTTATGASHQGSISSSGSASSSYLGSIVASESPLSPVMQQQQQQQQQVIRAAKGGRQLPQRPFKQSMSIDHHQHQSMIGGGHQYQSMNEGSPVHHSSLTSHRNLGLDQLMDPTMLGGYQQHQQHQPQNYQQQGQHFSPQANQYGAGLAASPRSLRLEMAMMEKQAANMNIYDPASGNDNPAARLPPTGAAGRPVSSTSSSSSSRQLPTPNQAQGFLGSMSLDQHHQIDPFHQQTQQQQQQHQDPYASQQLQHPHHHHHHQLASASTEWLPPVGASTQHNPTRSSGHFKQTMSIDHYAGLHHHQQQQQQLQQLQYSPARSGQHFVGEHYNRQIGPYQHQSASPLQPLIGNYESPTSGATGGYYSSIGSNQETQSEQQQQPQPQETYYHQSHHKKQQLIEPGQQQQQQQQQAQAQSQQQQMSSSSLDYPNVVRGNAAASNRAPLVALQSRQVNRPTLHHQVSSSSSNSNQSGSLKSSNLDDVMGDKQQTAAGGSGEQQKSIPTAGSLSSSSQYAAGQHHQSPQHKMTTTAGGGGGGGQHRPDMLRRGYTSLTMGTTYGAADLGDSQTALSESGDLSSSAGLTSASHAHIGLLGGGGGGKRSGLRAASPSIPPEASGQTSSSSGQVQAAHHHHHQHHQTNNQQHHSSGARDGPAGVRSESSTGLPNGSDSNSTLTKKSNSTTQLSMTGSKKRLGFRKKQVTSFSVHRSEEVAPLEARHLVKQGSSVSEGDSSISGDSSTRSWSNSNFKQQTPEELASMSFIDGLGKGQMISRQGLASPYLGDIQLSLCDRRGNLEVEVIRARNLQAKTNKVLPLTYVKLYLVKNRKCLAKNKTMLSKQRTLNPLFQEQLTFHEDYHGCILQSIVWGNFGKMDKKNFMGIAQISIDDLELSDTVISWYKLFLPSSLQTLPSKSLRHTLLSNSTESFTNTNNS